MIRSFLLLCTFCTTPAFLRAADHGDSPSSANNASADLADVFFYLDPNDNSKAVLELTVRGFIVPGEAVNMGICDPDLTYQFALESSGDAVPDETVTIGSRRGELDAIALRIPTTLLPNNGGVVGVEAFTFRADQHPVTLLGNLSTRGRHSIALTR